MSIKKIKVITVLIFTTLASFGQEIDSLQKEDLYRMIKEEQMIQKHLQPMEIKSFSNYFKPELIDSVFKYIQEENYNQLYECTDNLIKKAQSKEDLTIYLKAINKIYGKLHSYKLLTYGIKDQMISQNKIASGNYSAIFSNCNVKISTAFNVIDSTTIKLTNFQIVPEDYSEIKEFDKLTEPTFKYLNSKEYKKLYKSTSRRFRDYTPIAVYENFTNQLDSIDFKGYKLYRNQIGVIKGQLMYFLTYDINGKGFLSLTYVESEGKFLLEGLKYDPR